LSLILRVSHFIMKFLKSNDLDLTFIGLKVAQGMIKNICARPSMSSNFEISIYCIITFNVNLTLTLTFDLDYFHHKISWIYNTIVLPLNLKFFAQKINHFIEIVTGKNQHLSYLIYFCSPFNSGHKFGIQFRQTP
jgi:hypothetical protein